VSLRLPLPKNTWAMSTRFQTILNILALAVITFLAVDFFYMIIMIRLNKIDTYAITIPRQPYVINEGKPGLDYYRAAMETDLFGAVEEVRREIRAEEIENLEPTSLKIALLGTVVGGALNSFAIIEEKDKKRQGLYKVGDAIQSAVVKRILRGKVILRVNDKDTILTIEESATPRQRTEDSGSGSLEEGEIITVSRTDVARSLKDVHRLLTQARVRPHFLKGEPQGLSVSRIRSGSIFTKLGLKNGDIVQRIDGNEIKSPDDVLEMYKKLTMGTEVSIEILRKGTTKKIHYRFE
jgi:general secretion pathway protein C